MSKNNFTCSQNVEIKNRSYLINNFIMKIVDKDEQPIFISDDTTLFDISSDSEDVLLKKINTLYNKNISNNELRLKLWELIDLLQK